MRKRLLIVAVVVAMAIGLAAAGIALRRPSVDTLFGNSTPDAPGHADRGAVEVGVRFQSDADGVIRGIRFYKTQENEGPHIGNLWTDDGQKIATASFESETATGWQSATFEQPVPIAGGATYRASYHAPTGQYVAQEGGFSSSYRSGPLSVPAGGGVFSYGAGAFPTETFKDSNYYVDVEFVAGDGAGGAAQSPATSGAASPAPTQSSSSRPSSSTSGGADATPVPGRPASLDLPRIPWEGGSAYWKKFAKTDAADWDDPTFFPIVVWYNGISNDAEAQYDKSLGINSYIGMWEGTSYSLFERNGLFWIGGPINASFTDKSANWVGDFLDDEVDGRFTPAEGFEHLRKLSEPLKGDGRFKYANYTQMVMSNDMRAADAERYVNDFTDAVSVDMYFYTVPYCDLTPYRDVYITPVARSNCRTASSYGKTMKSLRARDATDGELQSLWQFVEVLNGGPGEGPFTANVTGSELEGAVMSSVINEARGIVYFNQSFTGPCTGSALFRQSQVDPDFCASDQVEAAKKVNLQIHHLAPVLNTQSYRYAFGQGLDTMLKAADDSIYVFAMVDGSSEPGKRTFKLPAGVSGRTVQVLFENRSISVSSDGTFDDDFASESSYHIYQIKK